MTRYFGDCVRCGADATHEELVVFDEPLVSEVRGFPAVTGVWHCVCDRHCDASAKHRQQVFTGKQARELIAVFDKGYQPSPDHWLWYAARHFGEYRGDDRIEAAVAILEYFMPSGIEGRDESRKRNGYTVTDNFHTMLRITLQAAS